MSMKTIREIADLKNKKVLLRADFDVSINEKGEILETFRIRKQKGTLNYLVNKGAKIILAAHISGDKTFSDLVPQLHIILGREIGFIKSPDQIESYFNNYSTPGLLENIRTFKGEIEDSKEFAGELSKNFDYYINNSFAVSHRRQASVSAVAEILPAYAGFQLEEEIRNLDKVLNASQEGKVIIIGGAKAETKIPTIKNLIRNSEYILTGGVVANDFLKAKGEDVGNSVVDDDFEKILSGLDVNDPRIILPSDFKRKGSKILDIGDETAEKYSSIIKLAKLVIWNGPMGLFEEPDFAVGTNKIAEAITKSAAFKILGGGDTITAVGRIGLLNKFDFVSTGGGAMLSYLAGDKLPGIEILK